MLTGILWVAAGGALGSVARHLISIGLTQLIGSSFPWGTLVVNIVGSFAMGLVVAWLASRQYPAPDIKLFLATGILGGFTTFSTFSLDIITMLERRDGISACLYAGASVLISLAAIALGLAVARAVWP